MNFQESTHKLRWLFTKQALEEVRLRLNGAAVEKIRSCAAEEPESEAGKQQKESSPITPEDERRLLKFYQSTIPDTCKALKLPRKVEATALVYLKRFYTCHSCMDYDPQRIMLTAIYLACKIEEWYTSAEDICRIALKLNDGTFLLRSEVVLLQGLQFDLVVHSPFRALDGFFGEIDACRRDGSKPAIDEALLTAPVDIMQKAQGAAVASCGALMLSDAPLTHPPGQVALAALRSGFKRVGIRVPQFMARIAGRAMQVSADQLGQPPSPSGAPRPGSSDGGAASKAPENPLSALHRALDEIDLLGVSGAEKTDQVEASAIDRRLKLWRNPLLDPASNASKKAAAADDKDRAERRDAKLRGRREAGLAKEAALLGHAPA